MYVEKLELENFRGFAGKHTVRMHPRLTVLVGLNGAGKSAVMDAVARCLSGMASVICGDRQVWQAPDPANISSGAEFAFVEITALSPDHPGTVVGGIALGTAKPVSGPRGASQQDGPDPLGALRGAIPDLGSPLPHLAYVHSSSTRAPAEHAPLELVLEGRLEAWKGAFDSESVQFDALETWFEREENLENQRKIELQTLKFELPSLKSVRKAVRVFLTELHAATLGTLRVVRAHTEGQLAPARGQLVIRKGDDELFLRQLSDGERRLVLLVADTARRMVILNPGLEDALLSPGVLLIDEIELHLHPQWQRRVIPALQAAFPKLQLIVSTHAPAVLATVPNECVVVLDGGKVLEGTPRVFGLDSNSILNGLMATPTLPDAIQARFDALYALIDDDPAAAPAAIDALAADVGADHPELVRARGLLVFLAG